MKNVCITGYGAIGPVHAHAMSKISNARFYAVCDINNERIRKCREKYDVKAYNSYEEMLLDKNIDSVHICTPHYLHFNMIKSALEAGKTVVAEKPVTMTGHEFEELIKLENSDKVCLVLQNRLNPCMQKLKELTDCKALGEIKAIKGIMTWSRDRKYYQSDDWRGKWETEGGGVLINQAIHTLDFMTYLAGGVKTLKADMMNYSLTNDIEVEDTFVSCMNFRSGVKGMFFATNAYAVNSSAETEIVFEKGTARYLYGKLMFDGKIIACDSEPTVGKSYWGTGHEYLLKDYYDNNRYFGLSDAKDTMDAMFAMYKSAKSGGKEIEI